MRKAQEEATQRGEKEGAKKTQIEIAKNLIRAKLPFELIAETTQLPIEDVKKIAGNINENIEST